MYVQKKVSSKRKYKSFLDNSYFISNITWKPTFWDICCKKTENSYHKKGTPTSLSAMNKNKETI